ncbi:MAG: site-specific integrase [Alphaproteobacteria bacterium]|nr:MAG: site-specific integrase [Alphaproteobacteria bacterium]
MKTGKLSVARCRTAPPGKYGDGGGLWLRVRPNGARNWTFRYMIDGRAREMGCGAWPDVSLAQARETAAECRRLLRAGRDPIEERRRRVTPTFRACTARFLEAHRESWRNAKHRQQWENTLATYADAELGGVPVDRVDTPHVLRVLEPVWTEKPETASRLRGRIERILDWAAARGYRGRDNPARWRGHLDALLPAKTKVRAVRHHAALPWTEIPAFMAALREREGIAARALELAILTAARSGEVRGMTWEEVDLGARVWNVPAQRMKAGRAHRVPLPERALAILREMETSRYEEEEFVFPGARRGRPLSDMSLSAVLKRMGCTDITVHGFRSSFRDWCAESTAFPREVAEAALAHVVADKVEAAYRRGDLFAKRQRLMEAWAAYCQRSPAAATVGYIGRV